MVKRKIPIIILLNVIFIFSLSTFGFLMAAEASDSYFSLHEEYVTRSYTDLENKPQKKSINGFLNIYNINDPIIMCGSEDQNLCNANKDIVSLPLVVWGRAGGNEPLLQNNRFKLFIPPGTTQINLIMYCQPSPEVKTVVRFGREPDCFNCTSNHTDFVTENSYNFDRFATEDVHLQNAGGQIIIYSRSLSAAADAFSDPLPITQGGWLYVNTYNQANAVGQIQYGLKVDKNIYTNWYNSYDSDRDKYGLKLGSTTVPPQDPPTDPPDENNEFSVTLGADTLEGDSPLLVSFNTAVKNGSGHYTYRWDFGDDINYSSADPENNTVTNTYTEPGTYTAKLTVTDVFPPNNEATPEIKIIVNAPGTTPGTNPSPEFSVTPTANPTAGILESSTFLGTKKLVVKLTSSVTGGSSPFTYAWDFGNGEESDAANPTVEYTETGDYTVGITVTDSEGNTAEGSLTINVRSEFANAFEQGKKYCIDNPQACGIITIDPVNANLLIKSLDIANGSGEIERYNLLLEFAGGENEIGWQLNPETIAPLQQP